jgi:nucleotide-binding universal stress UspA family protein
MKNILFPTDFSRNAKQALDFALELAKDNNAKLILFNAYQLPYNRADMMVSVLGILKEDSEAGLKEIINRINSNPLYAGVETEALSRVGDVVSTVTEIVREKDIDMVVMGTKGEGGLVEAIIGSNTASVIKNVNCPILAVPEGAVYQAPKQMAFAYDLKEIENRKDLLFFAELARGFQAKVQIFSVIGDAEKAITEKPEAQLKLNEFFQGLNTDVYFTVNGDIIEGIRDLIEENNPDWMVMVAKKYTLFESLFHTSMTKKMVFQTDKPLLILHNFNS